MLICALLYIHLIISQSRTVWSADQLMLIYELFSIERNKIQCFNLLNDKYWEKNHMFNLQNVNWGSAIFSVQRIEFGLSYIIIHCVFCRYHTATIFHHRASTCSMLGIRCGVGNGLASRILNQYRLGLSCKVNIINHEFTCVRINMKIRLRSCRKLRWLLHLIHTSKNKKKARLYKHNDNVAMR